ncbi:hypothetical protein NUW58_g3667 [Xylaria curta]|uniref:Uncharacterized protein n=1 Tax=Xylaria curta TaxID=42375 RepID=A0ACC1PB86_9PEZI|nr:hypothetical protein NUW58_g3667 [Xylaria curta]
MKATILNLAIAASLGSAVVAQPHRHAHHVHQKRENSPLEKREIVTTYVPATVTQYMLGNEVVSPEEAQAGLDKGLTSSKEDAVFIEKVTTSSSSPPPPPTTTSTPIPKPEPTKSSYPVSSGAKGIDADFPDGELDCTTFPSDYGALPLNYLGMGGWSGLQYTPNFSLKDLAISFIETGISKPAGQTGFYSYACPDGYVKTQWPAAQGSTGQSIGGLYCNSQGKLVLTRGDVSKKLCQKGISGITIKNKMSSGTSVCRTDYPGTENMVIPLDSTPGSSLELANVASNNYYVWQNKQTTLQYYVNKKGVNAEKGCRWVCDSDPEGCGNWAPINIGVGESDSGITYLSIFPNKAVSKAVLDFNIDISGDNSIKCYYHVGEGFSGGADGCTTGIPKGGSVTITFSE